MIPSIHFIAVFLFLPHRNCHFLLSLTSFPSYPISWSPSFHCSCVLLFFFFFYFSLHSLHWNNPSLQTLVICYPFVLLHLLYAMFQWVSNRGPHIITSAFFTFTSFSHTQIQTYLHIFFSFVVGVNLCFFFFFVTPEMQFLFAIVFPRSTLPYYCCLLALFNVAFCRLLHHFYYAASRLTFSSLHCSSVRSCSSLFQDFFSKFMLQFYFLITASVKTQMVLSYFISCIKDFVSPETAQFCEIQLGPPKHISDFPLPLFWISLANYYIFIFASFPHS